ncbi:MAG: DNA polymerase III subunit gamma/tau, partial [Tepidisphaeraceae bacterium]
MSYTVLARRYRSSTFDDLIGQQHVAQTLKKAIASGRIAHAYLFCGTRGTGKTSTARILAKALNCDKAKGPTTDPCDECESCKGIARGEDMDVIEIDAASNTGVDNVRDIIENSQYRPARSRFKVYIVDEVHMLSKSAFNALLKTLEEPPGHVKFILATTEPEKVLPTILSRCQRYDFRSIPTREIAGHLKEVLKKEKIKADDDAVLLVAKAGAGSMRDALSLLDRLLSLGENDLTVEMIEQLLGLPKAQLVYDLAQSIGESDTKATLWRADKMITAGMSPDTLVASLVDHLRNLLILRTCGPDTDLVEVPGLSPAQLKQQAARFDAMALAQDITVLEELRRQLRTSQAGRALLDATLVRLAMADQYASIGELLARVNGSTSSAPASPVQKKKFEPVEIPQPVESVLGDTVPGGATPVSPSSPSVEGDTGVTSTNAGETVAASTEDDDDGDLPAVGKVWEGPKLSLGAILKRANQQPPSAPAPSTPKSVTITPTNDVEPVDPANLPGVWQALLNLVASKGPGLPGLLSHGQYIGLDNQNRAVIRYSRQHETFVKMFERNGKKDQVREAFSAVLNQSVGVVFEVDSSAGIDTAPVPVSPAPASQRPAPRGP